MGVKTLLNKTGKKAADKVAKLSALSPEQLEKIEKEREKYLSEMPDPTDTEATELTMRLLAASSVEIFNAYLPQLKELYVPIQKNVEYVGDFKPNYNIRYFNITKWVTDKEENSLEKLVNVYEVLSNEYCNIALIFHRMCSTTEVFLAVTNTENANDNVDIENYAKRLQEAIKGNFPGSEYSEKIQAGKLGFLDNDKPYSVATASNIPAEKSEKFISQTIEKLLDGIVPETTDKEYTIILLATPILDVEERKLRLAEIHSGLKPYVSWNTQFTYQESNSEGSSATIGINVGASAGVQNGQSSGQTVTDSTSGSQSVTDTESESESISKGTSRGISESQAHSNSSSETTTNTIGSTDTVDAHAGIYGGVDAGGVNAGGTLNVGYSHGWNRSTAEAIGKTVQDTVTKGITNTVSNTLSKTAGTSIANTLGKSFSKALAATTSLSKAVNFGANFGANFARASNVTATIGKNESISQYYENYNIKHALELLEEQMKRYEQSTALGMWDFAAYILSKDQNVAANVAHSYVALTEGEKSYMSRASINLWRGDMGDDSGDAKEICDYLRELRHPLFGLNPKTIDDDPTINIYPSVVTATTPLSGKELALSLNFPRKSVTGFPVFECAEFGRNISSYDNLTENKFVNIGHIFHMYHDEENSPVKLSVKSLASHTFITGSTGSGKSNTVYQILNETLELGTKFLVIESAKGEYKHVFGNESDVTVYGTNPYLSELLRLNPFSFPGGVHIFEHLDRLVEIFNVCWPMYAAMPAVLKSAIEQSYLDCGWDLMRSTNKYGEAIYPTFADVAQNIKTIIDSSEYDAENKGAYKGSLLTRLESLTNGINGIIFTVDELEPEKLFEENAIVDLSRVGSTETKSLIMGMLVLKLQEYRMTGAVKMNTDLRHITVLEEAHNILRRTSFEQSSEGSNLTGKSVEMISNAIAEMRTYGEGFIIVDQAPGLLDMSAIRNTNTKIIMRLPDQSDRELVGRSANLNEDQITELAKLPCGVAAIYQNEWIQPVLCRVDEFKTGEKYFEYTPDGDVFHEQETKEISDSLLECIMNNEILRKDDKADIQKLRHLIIKSKLDSKIKTDFMEYIESNRETAISSLRKMMYDFLSAEKAIDSSKKCSELTDWANSVVNALQPSIKDYSKKQINLALALLIYEQTTRDASYNDLYCRFTEVYQARGGVL